MNPENTHPRRFPSEPVVVETPTGCLVPVASPALDAAVSLSAVDGRSPSQSPARRRRKRDDRSSASIHPSGSSMDMICRFQRIISIVEATVAPGRDRPEAREVLDAVQRLIFTVGKLRLHEQKRLRPSGYRFLGESPTPEISAASDQVPSAPLLQEMIGSLEQMRLSGPMENSEDYSDVLDKLNGLLRTEEDGRSGKSDV
ncbi:unnamed protein product [Spirodela intermedia]|uniref:Uncharacterized protein n=2 Tax=Spirodela intermedia TaxID=51605 RepID=A0A7I8IFL2_SPIIN|nr:unnamed protein product [Spirodela intermedia]CAA6655873.1 unnamed protein product [Spirodela intermedia]CAA7391258.1 unnamed protein product [Spirodela intermedia]